MATRVTRSCSLAVSVAGRRGLCPARVRENVSLRASAKGRRRERRCSPLTPSSAGRHGMPLAATGIEDAVREDSVLVFGATGGVGRLLMEQLLAAGREVVAAVRSAKKLEDMGSGNVDRLTIVEGVDMTKAETLTENLFSGVSQVALCSGASSDGMDPFSPEAESVFAVDSIGVRNVVAAAERFLTLHSPITLLNKADLTAQMNWTSSSTGRSTSQVTPGEKGITIQGTLAQEDGSGGGSLDQTTQSSAALSLDLTQADGVTFSIKGDGRTHFLQFQTVETGSDEHNYFAAPVHTVAGQWSEVSIPLHEFRLSKTGVLDQETTLKPSTITKIGWMSSLKTLDGFPNRSTPSGDFSFSVGSIFGYRAARPQLLLCSSGAVERNARLGAKIELRDQDVPILRLNPGGVLHHKYEGEIAVRHSILPYTIVRPTQLIQQQLEEKGLTPDLLEASQGDYMSGRLRRVELAELMVQCLMRPEATFKTFEVRRNAGFEAKGKSMTDAHFLRLLLTLSDDGDRAKVGLPPFPEPVAADLPTWSGGRKLEAPETSRVEDIEANRGVLHEQRDRELLGNR